MSPARHQREIRIRVPILVLRKLGIESQTFLCGIRGKSERGYSEQENLNVMLYFDLLHFTSFTK